MSEPGSETSASHAFQPAFNTSNFDELSRRHDQCYTDAISIANRLLSDELTRTQFERTELQLNDLQRQIDQVNRTLPTSLRLPRLTPTLMTHIGDIQDDEHLSDRLDDLPWTAIQDEFMGSVSTVLEGNMEYESTRQRVGGLMEDERVAIWQRWKARVNDTEDAEVEDVTRDVQLSSIRARYYHLLLNPQANTLIHEGLKNAAIWQTYLDWPFVETELNETMALILHTLCHLGCELFTTGQDLDKIEQFSKWLRNEYDSCSRRGWSLDGPSCQPDFGARAERSRLWFIEADKLYSIVKEWQEEQGDEAEAEEDGDEDDEGEVKEESTSEGRGSSPDSE